MTPKLINREAASDDGGPSRDAVFIAMSNRRRRSVVSFLKQHGEDARVRDIAEQLAAWENDCELSELTYKQRKRVYTSLHQSHLPKLAESEFITYEPNRGIASLTKEGNQLEVYLEVVDKNEILWSDYYIGLAVMCGLLTFAAWTGTVPFVNFSGYTYATLFVVLLGVSGIVHRIVTRRNKVG